ncbi:MAG: YiiX/YebB-like N1pC/P60 family cysteine hydrolase, partial [Planctomycetota bacterium]|nr:YiiX/YebB-like N1pC/P60 family cysteine hydrolase [Planctomycetota bacterium]
YWKHAALCLGRPAELTALGIEEHENVRPRWPRLSSVEDENFPRVLEAMKDGVRIRSVDSPFASDALVVLRPNVPGTALGEALARGLFHEGKPYDFDFDLTRSDRLVCTEVIYRSFEGVGDMRFELTRRAGRLTISAMDLVGMAMEDRHFRPLAVFCPEHGEGIIQGEPVKHVLRQTLDGG